MKKLLFLALSAVCAAAQAQSYPTHPVRLIIPYPPGGSNDVVGRMIAAQLSERIGQQIVVDNRGGAGGQLGTLQAASSPPDGYTLLLISVAYAFGPALYKDLKYDPQTAFAPITILGRGAAGVCLHPSVPASNVKELIALAKAKPGQLNYASAGVGSLQHLAAALFMSQAGIDVVHVPYKGGGPAMADVMAGQAQIILPSLIQTMPYIKSGRLKCIATTGSKRTAAVPDLPTVAESGLPGYEAHNWWGMMAPAGTPAPIVEKLHATLTQVLESRETTRRFETEGAEVVRMSPQEFGKFVSSELDKWSKVARDVGIKAE
ncbi:MAG TPA: tripartite tricarboxylate transporter substrate binding protein [Burkholderiales bacterium]|nr:tripartite tricarboxylate transporter substrate binding protein [Burkholderiales bacterium]